jgi:hypothetical protein
MVVSFRLRSQGGRRPAAPRRDVTPARGWAYGSVDERDWLAQRFQAHRPRLRAVACRMLDWASEAGGAVVFERPTVARTRALRR